MRHKLLALCLLIPALCTSGPAGVAKRKGTVCWPLHFAGITVGTTTDSQVQRLLGKGVFRADEGHTGGRYYLNEKQTATLHLEGGVDNVVESLTVRDGIDPSIKPTERKMATSRWFDPDEGFGNWHELHLGSTQEQVLTNLGPAAGNHKSKWVYETTCACELPEELTLSFRNGKVVQIDLYAGE